MVRPSIEHTLKLTKGLIAAYNKHTRSSVDTTIKYAGANGQASDFQPYVSVKS